MNRKILFSTAAGLFVAGAALTGCTGGQDFASDTPGASSSSSSSVPVPEPSIADTGDLVGPAIVQLGETYTYGDGLAVTVEQLPDGVIGPDYRFVAPAVGTAYPVYRFTITNNTGDPFDPAAAFTTLNYGAAGTAAQQLYGVSEGVTFWQGVILPGQSQVLDVPYDMPVGQDITVTFTPEYSYLPVIFTNLPPGA